MTPMTPRESAIALVLAGLVAVAGSFVATAAIVGVGENVVPAAVEQSPRPVTTTRATWDVSKFPKSTIDTLPDPTDPLSSLSTVVRETQPASVPSVPPSAGPVAVLQTTETVRLSTPPGGLTVAPVATERPATSTSSGTLPPTTSTSQSTTTTELPTTSTPQTTETSNVGTISTTVVVTTTSGLDGTSVPPTIESSTTTGLGPSGGDGP